MLAIRARKAEFPEGFPSAIDFIKSPHPLARVGVLFLEWVDDFVRGGTGWLDESLAQSFGDRFGL
jgi:hypothetical protein